MKFVRIIMLLSVMSYLTCNVSAGENNLVEYEVYQNGEVTTVLDAELKVGEPATIKAVIQLKKNFDVSTALSASGFSFENVDQPFEVIEGSSEFTETAREFGHTAGETVTFEWIVRPTDIAAGWTIPLNIAFTFYDRDENEGYPIKFTVANIMVHDEHYSVPAPTILIDDAIAVPNSYAFTSITVNNVTGLGSGDIIVTYNSSVVHAIDVTSGDGNALTMQTSNIDNTAGLVEITAWDVSESHNGDVVLAIVTFQAVGKYPDSTPLSIISRLYDYTSYSSIGHSVTNGTFSIIYNEPPVITDAIATPDVILNDNGRPRTPGTNVTVLNATVLNGTSGVVKVTIDLSGIGGSDDQVMERITGTDVWTVATTAKNGINLTHELVVTATDGANNTNTSVIELTVLLRGDVVRDKDLNSADALYIAKYLVGKEPSPSLLVSDMSPAEGDGRITSADALYLAKYLVGKEAAP
ncbi:MAG: sarcinarray family MAST domain-containing protein [ANME-2 cluster archaeon]|nr:sarcinarray family MAST domain-containing protein [ANME-2 cluster archaeon]